MKITAKTVYAIVATAELGKQEGKGVKAAQIAETYEFPSRFLELTLNELKSAGFINSRRGADGGFFLTKSPDDISLLDIVRHIEGDIHLLDCEKMGLGEDCVIGDIFNDIAIQMTERMSQIRVTDIMKKMDEKENNLMDFVI